MRLLRSELLLTLSLIVACSTPRTEQRSFFVGIRNQTNAIEVLVGGEPFAELEATIGQPFNLRSLTAPDDGPLLRRSASNRDESGASSRLDRPEQRSLWVAHRNISGVDFWSHPQWIRVTDHSVALEAGGVVRLTSRLDWRDGDGVLILTEARTHRFHANEEARMIDVTVELTAPGRGARFADTKDGFFALRLDQRFARDQPGTGASAFIGTLQDSTVTPLWGLRGTWCAASAPTAEPVATDSQSTDETDGPLGRVTVAIFDHPSNLSHPTRWQVRPYGLLAANPFGERAFGGATPPNAAFQLEPYEELVLRYRVYITDQNVDHEILDEAWREYAGDA